MQTSGPSRSENSSHPTSPPGAAPSRKESGRRLGPWISWLAFGLLLVGWLALRSGPTPPEPTPARVEATGSRIDGRFLITEFEVELRTESTSVVYCEYVIDYRDDEGRQLEEPGVFRERVAPGLHTVERRDVVPGTPVEILGVRLLPERCPPDPDRL